MSTLDTLVKLADKKLDDIQKQIHDMETAIADADSRVAELLIQVEVGYNQAQKTLRPDEYQDAGRFAARAKEEQDFLKKIRRELEAKKRELRQQLRDVFTEKKRYEILRDRKREEARAQRAKKNQATLEDLTNR
jgi:flagellar export protein FliJ